MSDNHDPEGSDPLAKYTLIATPEQLMAVYGDMFEKGSLYRTDVYLEKDLYDPQFRPQSRFMTTSAGLVTLEGNSIWDQDINDQEFLEGVQRITIDIKRHVIEGDGEEFDKTFMLREKEIKVVFEPYTVDTTDYVLRELKQRKELLHKKS